MTLYKFAIIPKTCGMCYRQFIFEQYELKYKYIFYTGKSVSFPVCKRCIRNYKLKASTDVNNGGVLYGNLKTTNTVIDYTDAPTILNANKKEMQ